MARTFVTADSTSKEMMFDLLPQEEPESLDIFDRNCVLILDENRAFLEYMAKCFSQQNFQVLSHTSGELGLATARKSTPDCILISTRLIDMDGIDLCRAIVDDSQTCGIPVIVLGSTENETTIKNAKAAGSQFFLSKPIDPRSLIFLVNESIAESRSWICD